MSFEGIALKRTFRVEQIYSIHYFEFSKDYMFPGEAHNFWEIAYVDKGVATAVAADKEMTLECGKIIFHQPNEWHNLYANGTTAPNAMVISFSCRSKEMRRFAGKIMEVGAEGKKLLSRILAEGQNAFSSCLDDPYQNKLTRASQARIGSEQMIGMLLEELLILLARRQEEPNYSAVNTAPDDSAGEQFLERCLRYMEEHVDHKMTLCELSEAFHTSQSVIKKVFYQQRKEGAIHCFLQMKLEKAKELLRESDMNVSQIAQALGYDNICYFSNQFHRGEGMSPLEYRRSVKAMGERARKMQENAKK